MKQVWLKKIDLRNLSGREVAFIFFFVLMAVFGAFLSFWGIFSKPFDNEKLIGGIILFSVGFLVLVALFIMLLVLEKKQEELIKESLLQRFEDEKEIALCEGLKKIEKIGYIQERNERAELKERAEMMEDILKSGTGIKNTNNSAFWGGAVSGMAGLGAGLYTAVETELENQKIREENELIRSFSSDLFVKSRLELANYKGNNKSVKELSLEMGASFEKPIETLASFITVGKPVINGLVGGFLEVTARWSCKERNNHIDGSYKVSLYDENNNLVGGAFLPLPADGTGNGEGTLSGICPATKGKYHHAVIEPVDLWEIVTPQKACKRYFNAQSIKEEKESFAEAISIDRTNVKITPPLYKRLLFGTLGVGVALGIAIGTCAGVTLSDNIFTPPFDDNGDVVERPWESKTAESVEGKPITVDIYRDKITEKITKCVYKGEGTVGYVNWSYDSDEMDSSFEVVFGEGITGIGEEAFLSMRNNINSVTIGKDIEVIDLHAFWSCENLSKIIYEGSIEDWLSIERITTGLLPSVEYELIIDGKSTSDELVIPGTVTKIPDLAFRYCKIEVLKIMDGVKEIGKQAFSYCKSLKTVEIPDSVEIIRNSAMSGCYNIELLKIGGGIKLIEDWGLSKAKRVEITNLANWCSVEMSLVGSPIGEATSIFFDGVSAEKIVIPNGVETISEFAFYIYKFRVKEIYIPSSVKHIEGKAISSEYASAKNRTKLEIYCEATEKPDGWEESWYYSVNKDDMEKGYEVVWGYTE